MRSMKRLVVTAFLLFAVLTGAVAVGVTSGVAHARVVASTCWTC